jgi:hypothetical protein
MGTSHQHVCFIWWCIILKKSIPYYSIQFLIEPLKLLSKFDIAWPLATPLWHSDRYIHMWTCCVIQSAAHVTMRMTFAGSKWSVRFAAFSAGYQPLNHGQL